MPRLNGYLVNTCTTVTQWLLDWGMLGNLLDVESSIRGEEGHSSGQVKYEATGYSRTFPGFTLWLKNAICCQKRAGFSSRWHFWYTCGKWWFLSNSLFSFPSLLCHTICLDISFLPYMQLYMWQNFQPIPNTPVTGIHVPYGLWLFLSCIWADTDYCSIRLKQWHVCLHTARLHTC